MKAASTERIGVKTTGVGPSCTVQQSRFAQTYQMEMLCCAKRQGIGANSLIGFTLASVSTLPLRHSIAQLERGGLVPVTPSYRLPLIS